MTDFWSNHRASGHDFAGIRHVLSLAVTRADQRSGNRAGPHHWGTIVNEAKASDRCAMRCLQVAWDFLWHKRAVATMLSVEDRAMVISS